MIYTYPGVPLNQAWVNTFEDKSIVFTVKACQDAEVYLAKYTGVFDDSLLVIIGDNDNTKSTIKQSRNGNIVAQVNSNGILSCMQDRTFWISWGTSVVAVGTGVYPNENTFLSADKPSGYWTVAVALSTGDTHSGTWTLPSKNLEGWYRYDDIF